VVVHDEHRTVLGVGDLIPSPRHDPPPRVARLVRAINPTCAYPGCPAPARRCDLDHRVPYEEGGVTCSCNLQALCRRHHRLKGTGMVNVEPVLDAGEPPGTLRWSSWTGRDYVYRPLEAAVAPLRPTERIATVPDFDVDPAVDGNPEPASVTDTWKRSLAVVQQQEARQREAQERARDKADRLRAWRDKPPPF
jgi:hypothetical protein